MHSSKNGNNKHGQNGISSIVKSAVLLPLTAVLAMKQGICSFLKKLKNKERYIKAAHYTLSSDSYNPKISSLFLCFKATGLGFFDSLFNALYMYVGEKHHRSEKSLRKRYGDTALHPVGYEEKSHRFTFWSCALKFLGFIPAVVSLPSKFVCAMRNKKAREENSFRHFIRYADFCRRKASYIVPVITALFVGAYIFNAASQKVVLNVSYDGIEMGSVENCKVIDDVITSVEETLSGTSGISMRLSGNVTYSASKVASPEYVCSSELYSDILSEAKKDYVTAYGLYIDGTLIAPLESKVEIEAVLSEISGGDRAEIANGIQVLKQDYHKSSIKTAEQLKQILGSVSKPREEVMVMSTGKHVGTDTHETAVTVLRNIPAPINTENVDFSNAYAIDDSEKLLEISYRTEEYEEKTVVSEFETRYEYDPNMYVTSKYVKQQGKNGTKKITEKIIYINGVEESRTVVGEEVIRETSDKVVMCGLKPIPESAPDSESFLVWPYDGEINEPFGWRWRDGYQEYHAGIDMRGPRGTPVLAAGSGVIEKAGNFHNGYGNMIIIHHADGKQTFYAHLNDIYVSAGDVVTQGTIIGEIGSTGDSTGNHLHFEVRVNGTPDNPLKHLVPRGE